MESPIPQDNLAETLARMRDGVDYRFTISIRKQAYVVRPLSCFELVKATESARAKLMQLPESQRIPVAESVLLAQEKLILANTSDVGAKDAELTDRVFERLNPDEVDYLFKQWIQGCARINPSMETIPDAELLELVELVKKNEDPRSALTGLSLRQLVGISLLLLQTKEG